ncbi:putative ATPase (AAA+ superfamily) [Methanocella conradii HZ254]|uniref:ATPase (AAA+ superfamily) n=1 Tax=Methanocella conradii (strain DSM 24694 / JCM 17849 / CGMCC 1.5162 / HZ254) TaxID=1041930 RepID=H8I5U7_METCZ|nr:ATP-binding protein [Methanocella conradii]AFC99764.1 putative ATPase (AAA+ superfamily) [Methanocella conradii HZ254]MDI6896520.1 ATP-binding protein [Methanocella conradii]
MLLKETLRKVAEIQLNEVNTLDQGAKRDILDSIDMKSPMAVIISGVRRCGKSTLLKQIMKKSKSFNYFNFEDERALSFDVSDFERLDEVFSELNPDASCYFFDEIQNVPEWERFVRRKLDEGKKFFITGSNSSLLSKELGTKLTGRHLTYELFPMSYGETLRLTGEQASLSSFSKYFYKGGFPGYIKYDNDMMLQQIFNDIVIKDVVVRYSLKDPVLVKNLAKYLMTNAGNEFSYNGLKKSFDVGTASTISNFVSYFEDSYLLFTIPKFSYSYKKQLMNPKKAYAIDHGLARANSVSFSADKGRILENIVFLQLRRLYPSIFYFREKNECDFIVQDKAGKMQAIQVCYRLDEDSLRREMKGLKEAMEATGIKKGTIVTFDQEDKFGDIEVMPAWKWLLNA